MPRQTFNIKNFNQGIISALDEEDIPQEAASDSLNIDGDVGQGILQGIPIDTEFLVDSDQDGSVDDSIGNIKLGEFIEKDGDYDLIYHDSSANKIKTIVDFEGDKFVRDLVTTNVSDNSVIIRNNKEVHIGTGNTANNVSKWIGYCGFGQFSGGTSWTITGATTATPIVVTAAGHTLKDGNLVKISGVLGITEANGIWIVASSDPSAGTFALTDSVGSGTWSAGGTQLATQYLCVEDARCRNRTGAADGAFSLTAAETTGTGTKFFVTTTTYYWAMSFIYDGYQESVLIDTTSAYPQPFGSPELTSDTPGADSEYYTLTLTALGADDNEDSFNKRITGINIYRAEKDSTSTSRGLFRFIAYVDINDTNWTAGSGDKVITIVDKGLVTNVAGAGDVNFGFATYEQNTGISENLSDTMVNYTLAAKGEGYLFVGKCYKKDLPDADRYIFRSKELRYDMFDWINDFLVMPEPITAMSYNNGRLYAFSLNKVYRIHPELYIEDVFEGAGALGQRSVLLTEYGMFFANQAGAYWMDNSGQIDVISKPIQKSLSGGKSWQSLRFDALFSDVMIAYSSKKKYVLFINAYTPDTDVVCAWAYNVLSKRWDFWNFAGNYVLDANTGIFTDKNGNVFLSLPSNTYQLLASTSNTRGWEWYSQDMTFGETRQDKKLVKIIADVTGAATITYGVNGATPTTAYTNDTYLNSKIMSVRVKLVGATSANTNYVDSLEVIHRPMIGKR